MNHKLDSRIKELRHKAHRAASVDECYEHLEALNKLQRQRFSETGKFLPAANGKIFTYDPPEDSWLAW